MSDKYAALKSRIEKALEDFTNGRASMHVPALDTDVDLVLYDCLELLAERDADKGRIADQREVMRQAAADIAYAIFNLTGADISRLSPGVVESTDPTDTALIAERNLRAASLKIEGE